MIKNKAFTLIELMISIVIIAILTAMAYAPYNYYQNKAKLKITTREISQLLYESRNMAVNGAIGNSGNVSIGIYFDNSIGNNNEIKVFSYPHDIDNLAITNIVGGDVNLIKTLTLKNGIQIDDIDGNSNLLFVFDSITGNLNYYKWVSGIRTSLTDDIIDINFSYKGSTSDNLKRYVKYFTSTNIIDY